MKGDVDTISPKRVEAFLEFGERGSLLEYHIGLLATDRGENRTLDQIAREVLAACEKGTVRLMQKRYCDGAVAYLAVHR